MVGSRPKEVDEQVLNERRVDTLASGNGCSTELEAVPKHACASLTAGMPCFCQGVDSKIQCLADGTELEVHLRTDNEHIRR